MAKILDFNNFRLIMEADEPAPAPAPEAAPAPADASAPAPAPLAPPAPDAGAPAQPGAAGSPATPASDIKFIFIQEAGKKEWYGHHDKDGGTKRFTVYSVTQDELTKWLEVHKLDQQKDLVLAALAGRRTMPEDVYKKFKKEIVAGTLGSDKGTVDVIFDSDSNLENPSTDDLNVVFLRSK